MIRGVALDKDQARINMARERAIAEKGMNFIALRLLDMTKNRIQGAIGLHSELYRDENDMPQFHFEERGMPISFEYDEYMGTMNAKILDVPHNRKFLASMLPYNFWKIEDPKVEAEIIKMANSIAKKARNDTPNPTGAMKEIAKHITIKAEQPKVLRQEPVELKVEPEISTGEIKEHETTVQEPTDEPEAPVLEEPKQEEPKRRYQKRKMVTVK